MNAPNAKSITDKLMQDLGVGAKPDEMQMAISYQPSINRLSIDFASGYQPNQELVRSQYAQGAIVPMWMEIAIDIFSRYQAYKEQGHVD